MLDVPAAPEAVTSRLLSSINAPPRRALGVLKVNAEWVGFVNGDEFAVWERAGHATRASGKILRRRGGTRVEARIELTRWTWILLAVIFALFVFVASGLLRAEGGQTLNASGILIAAAGALATVSFFWWAARRQRSELRRFLDSVFRAAAA